MLSRHFRARKETHFLLVVFLLVATVPFARTDPVSDTVKKAGDLHGAKGRFLEIDHYPYGFDDFSNWKYRSNNIPDYEDYYSKKTRNMPIPVYCCKEGNDLLLRISTIQYIDREESLFCVWY